MDNINVKSIVLFMLCISIVLHVAGYTAIPYSTNDGNVTTFLGNFVDLPSDETNAQEINMTSKMQNTLDDITNPSGGVIETTLMAAINVIKMLKEFLKLLVNVAIAPLVLFAGINGIPLITTKCGLCGDIIEHKKHGIV